jgi:hypothetical protein
MSMHLPGGCNFFNRRPQVQGMRLCVAFLVALAGSASALDVPVSPSPAFLPQKRIAAHLFSFVA